MPQTEYRVIDFLTDSIQIGHISIQVLCNTMRLNHLYFRISKSTIQFHKIGGIDYIISIYYQSNIIGILTQIFKGSFQRFCICTLLEIYLKQFYR